MTCLDFVSISYLRYPPLSLSNLNPKLFLHRRPQNKTQQKTTTLFATKPNQTKQNDNNNLITIFVSSSLSVFIYLSIYIFIVLKSKLKAAINK